MSERRMQLEDWLDDLCVRFLMNGPKEDLETAERICFRVEEAQWYYEDFIRPLDPALPSMSLRRFCEQMFAHCPLLSPFSQGEHLAAFEAFLLYKARIPVRGAIMLNEAMDHVVLVKGWKKGANWSFPRGKINKDEDDLDCAIREVYEETGFEIEEAGLVPENRNVKAIELNMHEQQIRLFVFRNVPMDTHFEPRTRKEISKIEWWRISDLPAFKRKGQQQAPAYKANNFYMVAPFLGPLRKWVLEQKKMDAKRATSNPYLSAGLSHDDGFTEEDQGADSNAEGFYPEPPSAVTNVHSLASATANLNRLLNISQYQPEHEVAHAPMAPPAAKDSGSALLALLQSRPGPASQEPPPQTPLDHMIGEAPMPPTPHHDHTRSHHFSNMPPPAPSCPPMQPQEEEFMYDQPFIHNNIRENTEAKYMQAQQHIRERARARGQENPRHYQPQHLIHPQPLPPHVQRAVFTGGPVHAPMVPQAIQQQPQPHYNHPVSMPPSIPQFPGLHAPMVPQVQQQSPPKLTSHSLALLNAFKNRDGAPVGQPESKPSLQRFEQDSTLVQHHGHTVQHSEHLTQHREPPNQRREPPIQHREPPTQRHDLAQRHEPPMQQLNRRQPHQSPNQYTQVSPQEPKVLSHEEQRQQYEAVRAQQLNRHPPQLAKQVSEAPEALHPHKMPQAINGTQSISPGLSGPRQPPSEQQKSALLGLFKGPLTGVQNPRAGKPPSATALPTTPTPSAVELSAVEPLSQHAATTSALLNDKRTPEHSGKNKVIPQINPETNLPFRAMTILSRPAELSNQTQEPPQLRKIAAHKSASHPNGKRPINGTSSQALPTNLPAFQPQILKRPSPASNAPEPSLVPKEYSPLQLPKHPEPRPVPEYKPVPEPRTAPLQQLPQQDHRQNLLSLFSKTTGESIAPMPVPVPAFNPVDRSRVGSLASAEASSRRGSQPPTSPANTGFLLSYLDAVAKGAQR